VGILAHALGLLLGARFQHLQQFIHRCFLTFLAWTVFLTATLRLIAHTILLLGDIGTENQ
jgi:hypothetical protein